MARLYGVSQRRIQQLIKIYKDTGEYQTLNPNRRPKRHLTEKEKDIIEKARKESRFGAQKSMVGGKLQIIGSDVRFDIFRTDFQSPKFRKIIKHLGMHQAPVMRWTKQSNEKNLLESLHN